MTIDPALVRRLCARREGTTLDFKQAPYPSTSAGRGELAKDLMAMANSLSPSQAPAHILVGVAEREDKTGKVVGVEVHPDDADLHGQITPLLNRTPNFSYASVHVEGVTVGVFEIRPGDRPIFPVTGKCGLRPGVALYRDGSATADADPDRIVSWSKEDDALALRLRELEFELRALELNAYPSISGQQVSRSSEELKLSYTIANGGKAPFKVTSLAFRVESNDGVGEWIERPVGGLVPVPPGNHLKRAIAKITREDAPAPRDQKRRDNPFRGGACRIRVECETPGGRVGMAEHVIHMN